MTVFSENFCPSYPEIRTSNQGYYLAGQNFCKTFFGESKIPVMFNDTNKFQSFNHLIFMQLTLLLDLLTVFSVVSTSLLVVNTEKK